MSYLSHADLGGREGFGAVQPEPEDLRFHADWERQALALTLAMGATGSWNIDQSRSARETLPDYAQLSYYQIWIAALEKLMTERALVSTDELAAGRLLQAPKALARKLMAADVPAALAKGSPTARPLHAPARYQVGDLVRTRALQPDHHTRIPGYVRGKLGRIERLHGAHVFAETNAQGLGEQPQHLYTVVFDGATLWGAGAAPGLTVSVDAWESTLEPAA